MIGPRSKYLNAFSVIAFSSIIWAQFQPQNISQLRVAVDLWVENDSLAMITYGDISTWDVSNVTNMYYAFCNA